MDTKYGASVSKEGVGSSTGRHIDLRMLKRVASIKEKGASIKESPRKDFWNPRIHMELWRVEHR